MHDKASGCHSFDIVLIPAIGADAALAWGGNVMFSKIPERRVLLYKHPTNVENRIIEQFAESFLAWLKDRRKHTAPVTPIHFAAHSTGGVVLQQAIICAMDTRKPDVEAAAILESCISIAFYGVPHKGSTVLSQDEFCVSLQKAMDLDEPMGKRLRLGLNPIAMADLDKPHYLAIDNLLPFKIFASRLQRIFTFIEGLGTSLSVEAGTDFCAVIKYQEITDRGHPKLISKIELPVVDSRSALLGLDNEEERTLVCRHADLCRFVSSDLEMYENKILEGLQTSIKGHASNSLVHTVLKDFRIDIHLSYCSDLGRASFATTSVSLGSYLEKGLECSLTQAFGGENVKQATQRRDCWPQDLAPDGLQWVHVPTNNMCWVPDVLKASASKAHERMLPKGLLQDSAWLAQQSLPIPGISHSRHMIPMCKFTITEPAGDKLYWFDFAADDSSIHKPIIVRKGYDCQVVIFMPFLHWDTLEGIEQRGLIAIDGARETSLRQKLEKQYLSAATVSLHERRTLIQYGHPNLRNSLARDADQVLCKMRGRQEEKRVVIVDQLWLWAIDANTLVTFFDKQGPAERSELFELSDLIHSVRSEIGGDPCFATQVKHVYDLAALLVHHSVTVLLKRFLVDGAQILQVYEAYIGILIEQHIESLRTFRDSRLEHVGRADQQRGLHSSHDLRNFSDLKDVEDELRIMDTVFQQQLEVIAQMKRGYSVIPDIMLPAAPWESVMAPKPDCERLVQADMDVQKYSRVVRDMIKKCLAAQDAYNVLLNMKQNEANLLETQVAREQNRSVVVFTVFTIIFLPLSFFTSFFGMNVADWSQNGYTPFSTIYPVLLVISATVTTVAIALAFNKKSRVLTEQFWYFGRKKWVILHKILQGGQSKHKSEDAESLDLESGSVKEPGIKGAFALRRRETTKVEAN